MHMLFIFNIAHPGFAEPIFSLCTSFVYLQFLTISPSKEFSAVQSVLPATGETEKGAPLAHDNDGDDFGDLLARTSKDLSTLRQEAPPSSLARCCVCELTNHLTFSPSPPRLVVPTRVTTPFCCLTPTFFHLPASQEDLLSSFIFAVLLVLFPGGAALDHLDKEGRFFFFIVPYFSKLFDTIIKWARNCHPLMLTYDIIA